MSRCGVWTLCIVLVLKAADWPVGSYLESLLSFFAPKKAIDTSPELVNALKKDSEILQNIDIDFTAIMMWFHVFFFSEAKPTDFKGTMRFVSFPPSPFCLVKHRRERLVMHVIETHKFIDRRLRLCCTNEARC